MAKNDYVYIINHLQKYVNIFSVLAFLFLCYYFFSMETFIKADIFFFITTIAVVVAGTFLAVIFLHIIGILRDLKNISNRARHEGELISQDIDDLRRKIREDGTKIRHIMSFFKAVRLRTKQRKKKVTTN